MEPAIRQEIYGTPLRRMESAPQEERQVQDWETRVGKSIFYVTAAVELWFFYWFNGIQCPC